MKNVKNTEEIMMENANALLSTIDIPTYSKYLVKYTTIPINQPQKSVKSEIHPSFG